MELLTADTFTSYESYINYLVSTLTKSILENDNNTKEVILNIIRNEDINIVNENITDELIDAIRKKKDAEVLQFIADMTGDGVEFLNKLIDNVDTLKFVLNNVPIYRIRLSTSAQKINKESESKLLGKELWEVKLKDAIDLIYKDELNSFLARSSLFRDNYKKRNGDLIELTNRGPVIYADVIDSVDINKIPKLLLLYLNRILQDPNTEVLKLEFFRYLDTLGASTVLCLPLTTNSTLQKIIGEYFYILYNRYEFSLGDIRDVSSSNSYMLVPMEYTLGYVLRDNLDKKEEDIDRIIYTIDFWEKEANDKFMFHWFILPSGNKYWIEWMIKRYKEYGDYVIRMLEEADEYDSLDYVVDSMYKYGYNLTEMFADMIDRMVMSIRVANSLMRYINMKRIISIYNKGRGDNNFRRWFEWVVLNQV